MSIICNVTASPKTPGELHGAAPPGVTESEPACGSPVEGAVLSHCHHPPHAPTRASLLRPPLPLQLVQRTFIVQ